MDNFAYKMFQKYETRNIFEKPAGLRSFFFFFCIHKTVLFFVGECTVYKSKMFNFHIKTRKGNQEGWFTMRKVQKISLEIFNYVNIYIYCELKLNST